MRKMILGGATALVMGLGAVGTVAQDAPFGTDTEVEYAKMLWDLMKAEKLARFRKTDPALDLAANELDLEVVDDSPKGF